MVVGRGYWKLLIGLVGLIIFLFFFLGLGFVLTGGVEEYFGR